MLGASMCKRITLLGRLANGNDRVIWTKVDEEFGDLSERCTFLMPCYAKFVTVALRCETVVLPNDFCQSFSVIQKS